MPLTVETFPDLLRIVETRPEWRRKLIKALFPEINLPKALQDLAEAMQRLERLMERMDARVSRLETDVGVLKADSVTLKADVSTLKTDVGVLKADSVTLKADVSTLKTDVGVLKADSVTLKADVSTLKTDVGVLKGKSHERDYRDKAAAIFGRYLRRGHNVTNEVADQLQVAEEAGRISEQEFVQVLAADLLWGGKLRRAEGEVVLVLEASWLAEFTDVERAVTRANILRKVGLQALPVVAGREWTREAKEAARELGAVMVTNGYVDRDSWPNT